MDKYNKIKLEHIIVNCASLPYNLSYKFSLNYSFMILCWQADNYSHLQIEINFYDPFVALSSVFSFELLKEKIDSVMGAIVEISRRLRIVRILCLVKQQCFKLNSVNLIRKALNLIYSVIRINNTINKMSVMNEVFAITRNMISS